MASLPVDKHPFISLINFLLIILNSMTLVLGSRHYSTVALSSLSLTFIFFWSSLISLILILFIILCCIPTFLLLRSSSSSHILYLSSSLLILHTSFSSSSSDWSSDSLSSISYSILSWTPCHSNRIFFFPFYLFSPSLCFSSFSSFFYNPYSSKLIIRYYNLSKSGYYTTICKFKLYYSYPTDVTITNLLYSLYLYVPLIMFQFLSKYFTHFCI